MTLAAAPTLTQHRGASPFGKTSLLTTLGRLAGQAKAAPSRFTLGVLSQMPGLQFINNPLFRQVAKVSDDIGSHQLRLGRRLPPKLQERFGVSPRQAITGAVLLGGLAATAYYMGWLDPNKLSQDLRRPPSQ